MVDGYSVDGTVKVAESRGQAGSLLAEKNLRAFEYNDVWCSG